MTAYVAGTLAADARARVQSHLDQCADCRSLVSDVARITSVVPPDGTQPAGTVDEVVHLGPGGLVAHFEIVRLLGRGGMGVVYLARDRRLERLIALKVIHPASLGSPQAIAQLLSEARTTARFNHPHIVTIHEVGEHQGCPYMALEYLPGQTLRQRLVQGPLEPAEALRIGQAVAEALVEAHRHQVLHLDLTPGNVILTDDGRVRVLDFGLARRRDASAGDEGIHGTPGYMAPEQWRGDACTEATDMWALGLILCELLAVRPRTLGPGASIRTLAREVAGPAPMPSVRTLAGRTDNLVDLSELTGLIDDCLQKDPARRPSAPAMAAALRRARTSATTRSRGRRRISGAAGVVLAALLVTGLVAGPSAIRRAPPPDSAGRVIAVLPFRPLSPRERDEPLEQGIANALITRLSGIGQLVVRPTTAVSRYTDPQQDPVVIGRALRADLVIDGGIQIKDNRLRVTAQLVRVADQRVLWAQQFDEERTGVFAVQDAISEKLAQALVPRLTPAEHQRLGKRDTEDVEAYQLYLRGRHFWNKRTGEGLQRAIAYFEQAIARDPRYARAYAGLADAYALLSLVDYGLLKPREGMPRARSAARRALELDDSLAEAHASLGFISYTFDWDFAAAETHFRRAIALDPNYATGYHWYGLFLTAAGRPEESLAQLQRALDLDPLSLIINADRGMILYYNRQYEQAIRQQQKVLEIDPNFSVAWWHLGRAHAQQGRYREAEAALQRAVSLSRPSPTYLGSLGYLYGKSGQRAAARRVIGELLQASERRYVFPNLLATVYAGLGENDEALVRLREGLADRCFALVLLPIEPMYDGLRDDPRFQEIQEQVRASAPP